MTINASARKVRVFVGATDFSASLSATGIQIGMPKYANNGLMPVKATVSLIFNRAEFAAASYRLNPTQWKRGQTVSIEVIDTAGNYQYLPLAGQQLYLARPPKPPVIQSSKTDSGAMVLDLVCRLGLMDFKEPNPDKDVAGVTAGTLTGREVVVANCLDYALVPNSISDMGYDLDYPIAKLSGSFVQFAGNIADRADRGLYCQTDGECVDFEIDLTPSNSPILTVAIGQDEKLWEPIGDVAEQPVEVLKLTGTATDLIPSEGFTQTITDQAPYNSFFPTSNQTNLIDSQRTTITFAISEGEVTTTEILRPFVAVFPTSPYSNLVFSSREIERKTYDRKGKLSTVTLTTYQPAGVVFGTGTSTAPTTATIKTTTYTYDSKERVSKIVELTRTNRILLIPSGNNTSPIDSEQITTTYTEIGAGSEVRAGSDIWQKREKIETFDVDTLAFTTTSNKSTLANDGTSTPPATIYRNPDNSLKERQLKATVTSELLANDPFRAREQSITVDFCVSDQHLYEYGVRINKLIVGRSLGWRLALPLTDELLSADVKPFMPIDVIDGDVTYHCRADALQFALNKTEAYFVAELIEVGVTIASVLTPPTTRIGVSSINSQMQAFTTAITVVGDANLVINSQMQPFTTTSSFVIRDFAEILEMVVFDETPTEVYANDIAYEAYAYDRR